MASAGIAPDDLKPRGRLWDAYFRATIDLGQQAMNAAPPLACRVGEEKFGDRGTFGRGS
jgi:hypothetical protein